MAISAFPDDRCATHGSAKGANLWLNLSQAAPHYFFERSTDHSGLIMIKRNMMCWLWKLVCWDALQVQDEPRIVLHMPVHCQLSCCYNNHSALVCRAWIQHSHNGQLFLNHLVWTIPRER